MLYNYWLLRYVPNNLRTDTVSAGVVVISEDQQDIAVTTYRNYSDIPDIGGPRKEFARVLRSFADSLQDFSPTQQIQLDSLSTPKNLIERQRRQGYGVLQIDPPKPAVGKNARELSDLLFEKLVSRAEKHRGHQYVTKLRKEVTSSYLALPRLSQYVITKPSVQLGKHTDARFDLAVNGENYSELNRSFSFVGQPTAELRDRILAWTFEITKLRNAGAKLDTSHRSVTLPAEVPVLAVVEMPQTKKQYELFEETTEDWFSLGIQRVTSDEIKKHANTISLLV